MTHGKFTERGGFMLTVHMHERDEVCKPPRFRFR
jgi:hypothetical protein